MERLKKFLFVGASSLLLFCFPAFAEESEASELPIEEVTHNVELINDSSKEASDITIDNLSEIQSGMLRSPSINPDIDFSVIGYTVVSNNNRYYLSLDFTGNINKSIYVKRRGFDFGTLFNPPNYNTGLFDESHFFTFIYYLNDNNEEVVLYSINKQISSEDAGSSSDLGINYYLSFVTQVFSWLLTTIGVLITFILGNPFLAVSLLLFMAGTVISFYIRIKNS